MEILSIILAIVSIAVSIILYYSVISKKLDILIERNNTLRLDQAKDLIRLYLDSIQRELHIAIRDFIEKEFDTNIKANNFNAISRYISHNTEKVIADSHNKVALFMIIGGQSLKDFIESNNPLYDGIIKEAIKKALKLFDSENKTPLDSDKIKSLLYNIAEEAGRQATIRLNGELEKKYSRINSKLFQFFLYYC